MSLASRGWSAHPIPNHHCLGGLRPPSFTIIQSGVGSGGIYSPIVRLRSGVLVRGGAGDLIYPDLAGAFGVLSLTGDLVCAGAGGHSGARDLDRSGVFPHSGILTGDFFFAVFVIRLDPASAWEVGTNLTSRTTSKIVAMDDP